MTFNLLVCYQPSEPRRGRESFLAAIDALGPAAAIYGESHYVKSRLPASEAVARLWQAMRAGDSVFVLDATNGEAAWKNLDRRVAEFLKESWRG